MCKDKNNDNNKDSMAKREEDDAMKSDVLDLNKYKENKSFNLVIDIPFIDMILDKNKRQCIYKKYDKNYKSSTEEDEIFKQMTARRKDGDE